MNTASIRRWHSYLGLFMAPSVLFFTLTGAAQLFGLHEAHGQYRPPLLVEKLSSVHIDQAFESGHHEEAAADAASPVAAQEDDKPKPAKLALKVFFLLTALCLVTSTTLGLWMGFTQTRRTRTAWILVLAGALIPTALLLF